MSALPPKVDINRRTFDVRFVPNSGNRRCGVRVADFSISPSARGNGLHPRLPYLSRCSRIASPKCAIEIGKVTETHIKRHRADVCDLRAVGRSACGVRARGAGRAQTTRRSGPHSRRACECIVVSRGGVLRLRRLTDCRRRDSRRCRS